MCDIESKRRKDRLRHHSSLPVCTERKQRYKLCGWNMKKRKHKEGTLLHLRGLCYLSEKTCQFLSRNNLLNYQLCKHSCYRIFRVLRMLDFKYRRKALLFLLRALFLSHFSLSRVCLFFHFVSLPFSIVSPYLHRFLLRYIFISLPHPSPSPAFLLFPFPFLLFPDKKLESAKHNIPSFLLLL